MAFASRSNRPITNHLLCMCRVSTHQSASELSEIGTPFSTASRYEPNRKETPCFRAGRAKATVTRRAKSNHAAFAPEADLEIPEHRSPRLSHLEHRIRRYKLAAQRLLET